MVREDELRRWMDVFVHSRWGIVIGDEGSRTLRLMNPAFAEMHGYTVDELIGRSILDVFAPGHKEDAQKIIEEANTLGRYTCESKHVRKDGSTFPVLIDLTAVKDDDGKTMYRIGNIMDITEIKKATDERDRFFDLSIDMLCIAGTDGYFKRLNPSFQHILGYTLEELMARPFFDFVHPDDLYATITETEKLREGIPTIEFENRYRCKDGTYKWISWHCMPHSSGALYAVARDVSAEREIQKTLRLSLKEKEVLLKEIHHRVKNNLQVITSLLNMQIRMLEDKVSKDALIECQSRIQAIALIHEKLYQSADYSRISFAEYVQSLINDIFHATGVSTNQIALEMDIPKISLPIDKAIPCALILNELVTNSLKHGFPNQNRGIIGISMSLDKGEITFRIRDSGVGLPNGMDIRNSPSLGLQLVCTLVDQLNASIGVDQKDGTSFTIKFAR